MPFYFNNNNNKAQKKKPKAVKLEWNHDAVFLSLTPFFHLSSQVVKFLTRQLVCSVDTLVWRAPRVPLVCVLLLRHKKKGGGPGRESQVSWGDGASGWRWEGGSRGGKGRQGMLGRGGTTRCRGRHQSLLRAPPYPPDLFYPPISSLSEGWEEADE